MHDRLLLVLERGSIRLKLSLERREILRELLACSSISEGGQRGGDAREVATSASTNVFELCSFCMSVCSFCVS